MNFVSESVVRAQLCDTSQRGAKRLTTSLPRDAANVELDPPPLSDADLQSIKYILAGHNYTFASINAISKESAIKKKELEKVIVAYRKAVDKLMMAYIQVKAVQDTTSKIWRLMKSTSRDDPGSDFKPRDCGSSTRVDERIN
ncbi:chitobiosyldiphosphodolichol beta-mannosyltransferase [Lasius niger]|uniref:Chitobiosyldiphosphodolichol beta-mannosyltransferase n=1 Tax=Lasius niger TaxID=67767 RepID=A0A0J7KS29_LASNI|nr:chitobiosyldiphosphodolichol beta-mannosyltransferase [Lasius niger]